MSSNTLIVRVLRYVSSRHGYVLIPRLARHSFLNEKDGTRTCAAKRSERKETLPVSRCVWVVVVVRCSHQQRHRRLWIPRKSATRQQQQEQEQEQEQ